MQNKRLFALAALALTTFACSPDSVADRAPETPGANQPVNSSPVTFLANVPQIPGSRLMDTTGAVDAQRATFFITSPLDSVKMFYLRLLPALGWRVRNNQSDSMVVNLYLEKDTSVLWIRATPGSIGTIYTMIGSYTGPPPTGVNPRR